MWKWTYRSFTPRPLYPWRMSHRSGWTAGWVGPTVGLDDVERRRLRTQISLLGRPLCNQSLALPTTLSLILQFHHYRPRQWLKVICELHALAALTFGGKEPRYPLDMRLRGPPVSPHTTKNEKSVVSAGNRTLAVEA
jgi:hypothetical protein